MKTFLLLLFSLMTGRDAADKDKRCSETWAECEYPDDDKTYERIVVGFSNHHVPSNETDTWENKGTFFLYHDRRKKKLRVVQLQLQRRIKGFECLFYETNEQQPVKESLEAGDCKCKFPLNSTQTHTSAKTNICGHNQDRVQFFCKQSGSTCENLLTSTSQPNSRFSLSNGVVSISNASSQDQGVYWCGLKLSPEAHYCKGLRKIQLEVQKRPTTSTASTTASLPPVNSVTASVPPVNSVTASVPPVNSATGSVPPVNSVTASVPPLNSVTAAPFGGSSTVLTAALVSVAVLVLLLGLIWLNRRLKKATNREAQLNKEDHSCAEIQELPQKLDPGTALHTTYATVTFPTNPSAFLPGSTCPSRCLYSTINLPQT